MDLDLRIFSFKDLTFESRKSLEGFANPNPNLFESAALIGTSYRIYTYVLSCDSQRLLKLKVCTTTQVVRLCVRCVLRHLLGVREMRRQVLLRRRR